jgi:predicted transcriptional regulator of viral defense system
VIHHVPELHLDDVTIVDGIAVTSVARTLIDCAEDADRKQLRDMFARARELGILNMDEVAAARARVEWRPSLAMLDEVIAEFT